MPFPFSTTVQRRPLFRLRSADKPMAIVKKATREGSGITVPMEITPWVSKSVRSHSQLGSNPVVGRLSIELARPCMAGPEADVQSMRSKL